jgi:hypothetical protein
MKMAVDGMQVEQNFAIQFFSIGVFFFHMSSLFYAWVAFDELRIAIVVSAILMVFLIMFFFAAIRIHNKFKLDKVISGSFGSDGSRVEAQSLLKKSRGGVN